MTLDEYRVRSEKGWHGFVKLMTYSAAGAVITLVVLAIWLL